MRDPVEKSVEDICEKVDFENFEDPILRNEWGRIIRPVNKNKKHVIMHTCNPGGSLFSVTIGKKTWSSVPGTYRSAWKAQWGGLWPHFDFKTMEDESKKEKPS